jgi:GAF domain-containing protein
VELGYRSVVAVPMRLRGEVIGGLNLFLGEPDAVSGVSGAGKEDLRAAQALADMATIGILQQRAVREAQEVADQLRVALDTRIVIEQAKGILAAQLDLGLDESYQVMRWFGRNRNLVLRQVATAVVTGQLSAAAIRSPQ